MTREEVDGVIKRMAKRKAAGSDEIESEVWIHSTVGVRQGLVDLFNKVWLRGEIPSDWDEAIIVPIHKSGDKNYQRIIEVYPC